MWAKLCYEEPNARIALVRVCEGRGRQRPRLLGDFLTAFAAFTKFATSAGL